LLRMWKEAVLVYLKICCQNMSRGTEENSDSFVKVDPSVPRLQPGTFRIRIKKAHHCTANLC
jgi:hypothetical protein